MRLLSLAVVALAAATANAQYGSSGSQAVQSYGSSGSQATSSYGWRPFQRLRASSYSYSYAPPQTYSYSYVPPAPTIVEIAVPKAQAACSCGCANCPCGQAAPLNSPVNESQVPACEGGNCPLPLRKKVVNKLATALFEPCPKSL